jgi:hypothetical protein
MRKAVVAVVALAVLVGLALGAAATAADGAGAKFVCTHCKIGADNAGKCPLCSGEMKKAGTYVCAACDTTSEKPGKCSCGKDYVKVEVTGKKCPACGYTAGKDATGCAVCKKMQSKKPA